jgi:hypothetical protein
MQNVSGFGSRIVLRASVTFPAGIIITQFADDADPFDIPEVQIADTAMGLNGDLVVWTSPNPIVSTLNVIPGTDDDRNLAALYEANRPSSGKRPAQDVISMTQVYPDGRSVTLARGVITNGRPGQSTASSGRLKSKPYAFTFEGISNT